MEPDACTRSFLGKGSAMSILPGADAPDGLRRETRDSAALILMALAVVLTISFLGLALA